MNQGAFDALIRADAWKPIVGGSGVRRSPFLVSWRGERDSETFGVVERGASPSPHYPKLLSAIGPSQRHAFRI